MAFIIERYENLKAGVFRIAGDIDLAVVPEMHEALDGLIGTGFTNIVLDLSDVRYADSSALGLLVWLDRRLQESGGRVVLAGADRNIQRILEISGITSVAPSLEASVNAAEALSMFDSVQGETALLWDRRLVMEPGAENLAQVREQVCELLATLRFNEAAMFDMKVALGEALANAIRHGSVEGQGKVIVGIHAYEDRVVLEVTDVGTGFDGQHVSDDDLYASGGRGIMFMRALMDSVAFTSATAGGTVVTLVKRRSASSQE